MYDDKLQFLSRINQEVLSEPLFKTFHIVHLNLEPLLHTVHKTVESYIISLGSLLKKSAKEELYSLKDELMVLICVFFFVLSIFLGCQKITNFIQINHIVQGCQT